MTKAMTFEQIEKAQKFADFVETVTRSLGYMDMDVAKAIFKVVNGTKEETEDITSDDDVKFHGKPVFSKGLVIDGCKCGCK